MLEIKFMEVFLKSKLQSLQKAGVKVTVAYNEIWPLTLMGKIHEEKWS